jgi:hypothetical protein
MQPLSLPAVAAVSRPRSGSHLKKIGETWYYRRVVPPEARHLFGKSEVKFSLKTSSRVEAERLEKLQDVEFEAKLTQARTTAPDGWSSDPPTRLEQMIDHTLVRHTQERIALDIALTEVPVTDRLIVADEIEHMADLDIEHQAKLDRIIQQLDMMVATAGQTWDQRTPGLQSVIQAYLDNLATEHTVEWAFARWCRAKARLQQTTDEALRHLGEFTGCVSVHALSAIRRTHLLQWRDALQDAGDLAPKSINQRLQLVSAILRQGWRDAEIAAPDLQRINVPEPADSPRSAWEREDLLKALRALRNEPEWARWVFIIALTTGTRLAESVAAKTDWYDPLGFLDAPKSATKKRKYHVMPLLEMLRDPLVRYVVTRDPEAYLFDAPRPGNPNLKISHEVSKWFSRFRQRHGIGKVIHELRHTWKEAARVSPIKKEIHDIITGHAAMTVSDKYGGAKPDELLKANEIVCQHFLDEEIVAEIKRLVGANACSFSNLACPG